MHFSYHFIMATGVYPCMCIKKYTQVYIFFIPKFLNGPKLTIVA